MEESFCPFVNILGFPFFQNILLTKALYHDSHKDVEISGGNLSDKYEYVMVSKV